MKKKSPESLDNYNKSSGLPYCRGTESEEAEEVGYITNFRTHRKLRVEFKVRRYFDVSGGRLP